MWKNLLNEAINLGIDKGSQYLSQPVKRIIADGIRQTEYQVDLLKKAGQHSEAA